MASPTAILLLLATWSKLVSLLSKLLDPDRRLPVLGEWPAEEASRGLFGMQTVFV
jgi:hypothetical protein